MPKLEFVWLADHPALDFLNTSYLHKGEQVETLTNAQSLLHWLDNSGLLEPHEVPTLRRVLPTGFRAQGLIEQAVELRRWFHSFVAARAGESLAQIPAGSMRRLNELLEQEDAYSRVVPAPPAEDGSPLNGFRLTRVRRWREPSQLLQPVAAAMADLVCHADFQLVRRCEAPDCAILFLDRTKSHRRRWCSMALCGNRMKAAAFRARQ